MPRPFAHNISTGEREAKETLFREAQIAVVLALGAAAVVCNLIVLWAGVNFYVSTYPGANVDICSGTPDDLLDDLLGAVGLLVGLPFSYWAVVKAIHIKNRAFLVLSIVCVMLDVAPIAFGRSLDNFVIRVHASGVTSDAVCNA